MTTGELLQHLVPLIEEHGSEIEILFMCKEFPAILDDVIYSKGKDWKGDLPMIIIKGHIPDIPNNPVKQGN